MTEATAVPLRFDGVEIVRAPGFETGGFRVPDLSPGVTIVHGPNAAGKSTFARSLHHLLWPSECDGRSSLVGRFSLDGESWRVEVDGSRADYQLDGQPAGPPALPPVDQRDRYFLALDRFLQDGTTDETLAQAIKRESAGGYDLAAAHETLGFSDSPSTRRLKVVDQAESAVDEWRKAKRRLAELEAEQSRLAPLRRELEGAKRARERVALLEDAIDYAEARDRVDAREAALEPYPDILAQLDGDEAEAVEHLDARIEEWAGELEDAEAERAAARDDIADVDLPAGGLPTGFVSRLKNRQDRLSALEDRRQDRQQRLAGARRRRERALEDVPFDADPAAIAELEPVAWHEFADYIDAVADVRSDRTTLAAVERWLGDGDPAEPDRATLQRGRQCLESWLAATPDDADEYASTAFRIALVSGLAVAGAAVALGYLVHPAFALFLAVAAWLLWTARKLSRASTTPGRNRETYRQTYLELGLDPPQSWTDADVRSRLHELYDAIAGHRLAEEREHRREALEPDIASLEEREQALEAEREALSDTYGIEPDASDVELAGFVKGIARWQESHDEAVDIEAQLERIDDELEAVRTAINDDLEPYGYDPVEDAAEAAEVVNDIEERGRTYERASDAIEQATATIERAEAKLEALESEREAIFARAGLEPDEPDRLRDLCDQYEAYAEARSALDEAELLLERAEQALESHADFQPGLKDRTVSELETEQREAETTAERYEALHEAITAIETKVREAKREDGLETAVADRDRALSALEDQLHADYRSMVGHVLVEHLRTGAGESSQSAVLRGARDIFATITTGRYRLDVDEREGTFRAFDTVEERGYSLDELSSGTRLQLLLSVRVAFVEHQEPGVKLPLILDETLANTDDGRAEIVIDSMLELARDGRQVVYLTAQGDEVAKWLRALEDADDVDHTVIDLAEVRKLDNGVSVPDLEALAADPASPPDPDPHDHESYGAALDVPEFDPRRGAGHVHLWYLVEDLDLLCHLLELGIERWGQFDALAGRLDHAVFAGDAATIERVRQNGTALEEFVRCWQRGRGEIVTRAALEESGAVSDTFIDAVADLAADLDGDGERLIEALRDGHVNRFRSDKTDELAEYFEAEGYIEPAEPLDADQLRTRVAAAYVNEGVDREQAIERSNDLLARLAVA